MIYCFYGNDEYGLNLAVQDLLNDESCQKIPHITDADLKRAIKALRQYALTQAGWIWLQDTTALQTGKVNKELQAAFGDALEHRLPQKRLLITCEQKPNGTLGLTRWLQQNATIQAFELTPAWDTPRLTQETAQDARQHGVRLQPDAVVCLVTAVGNQRRERAQALERLRLYQGNRPQPLTATEVLTIVQTTAATALRLGSQLRERQTAAALETLYQLLERHEEPLQVLQSLVTQARSWLWIKSMLVERRHSDLAIAQATGLGNPNQLYYRKQELQHWTVPQLSQVMACLLQAEWAIKQGGSPLGVLKTTLFQIKGIA